MGAQRHLVSDGIARFCEKHMQVAEVNLQALSKWTTLQVQRHTKRHVDALPCGCDHAPHQKHKGDTSSKVAQRKTVDHPPFWEGQRSCCLHACGQVPLNALLLPTMAYNT